MPNNIKTSINKGTTFTFYVLHFPILLLILGVLAITAFFSSNKEPQTSPSVSTEQSLGYVLGDDSDDEDEDKDKNEDDRDEDDDDDDEDNKGNDDRDDDDDEEDDEDEFEQEDDDDSYENKTKTQERVQNSNGTYSIVKTETEGDKVKIETKTYDATGKLLTEEKSEGSDEGFESETEDASGNKFKIRVQDTEALIKREGVTGLNNFPLYLDESDGSVYVQTPNGDVKLGVMPQAIVEKAASLDDVDSIEEVELESESDDKLEFKLKTNSSEKLFGIFKLEIPSTVYFDAQNGEQLRSEQTFINRVLAFLSF